MFVKPKDGLSVRCPVKGSPLPPDGAEVPANIFWRRRLSDGDVVPATLQTIAPAKGVSLKKEGETE
ncbi:DUF2635 domain-containing protein [Escherichia coli]|uniref:DUF2635 domain-containing protein n=1 Tax=Escherichia coli TaxID=562 RepID=UPI0015DDCD9A|nr:DUF2635 domain-containing protein [Escherichia coli]DAJ95689.1 MAG TPA: Protein of unknown function (DUF2635) [Caudoviricetes sp.]EFE7939898.1 DUF2635 domain-containing protein [Escherichia coli]EFG4205753.1 DUF2635 domain-containing protein [Escherichia coli]ELH3079326.1 DUF2635 domain-containing protein [Escherichia coli]MDA6764034.1 DUF2635 domain-containing protein [Escherichia coli]